MGRTVGLLSGSGVRRGMHAMLRDFMNAAGRRLGMAAIEVVQRAGTFANRKTVCDGLGDVGLGKHGRFAQPVPGSQMRGDGRSEGAAGPVRVLVLDVFSAEDEHIVAV